VGTPVGFVGAKESKELLETYDIPFVTVTGYKGGSAVAAATINALLLQLYEE
jgi:precorrin-8X/cobalt-precorrin-8 methylmutase